MNEITKKFNNSETVKNYKEYGYNLKATSNKDTLTITSTTEDTKSKVEFKLEGDILVNENLSNEDLMATMILIDSIGQTYGYKDGELAKNLNSFPDEIQNLTPDDFDILSDIIADGENGNQSGVSGNIAYDAFIGDEESTIEIGQDGKLSDSAYKSILSALEVMYGEDISNHFQEIYPEFVDGKTTIEAFTIETNYKIENQDESMFKDKKVVLVTIDNNKLN